MGKICEPPCSHLSFLTRAHMCVQTEVALRAVAGIMRRSEHLLFRDSHRVRALGTQSSYSSSSTVTPLICLAACPGASWQGLARDWDSCAEPRAPTYYLPGCERHTGWWVYTGFKSPWESLRHLLESCRCCPEVPDKLVSRGAAQHTGRIAALTLELFRQSTPFLLFASRVDNYCNRPINPLYVFHINVLRSLELKEVFFRNLCVVEISHNRLDLIGLGVDPYTRKHVLQEKKTIRYN